MEKLRYFPYLDKEYVYENNKDPIYFRNDTVNVHVAKAYIRIFNRHFS